MKAKLNSIFRKFAVWFSTAAGQPSSFIFALLIILLWGITGPLFDFSNTWQLFINTFTTIATLLMVFLIQNTQNRDSKAIHLKLDELLKSIRGARDTLVDVEEMPDEIIDELHEEFQKIQAKAAKKEASRKKKKK